MAERGGGIRFLTAGAVSAALLPALVLIVHAPLWAGIAVAGAAFGGLILVLAPRQPLEDVDIAKIGAGRLAVVRAALNDAMAALDQLDESAARIRDPGIKARVKAIAAAGRGVVADLDKSPENLSSVQRLLTYYTPRAAELARGYAELESRGVGADRRASIADLLEKLQGAFGHYRDQLADQDLRSLDVDIRLIGQALEEDIGPMPTPGSPTSVPAGGRRGGRG
jgi:hypothetical protein